MKRLPFFHTTIRLAALLFSLGCSGTAFAVPMDFSFTGTFNADDDVQLINFTTDGASTVRLISYSYGGGTQADGNIVPAGGFDPILALFDSAGNLVGQNDDSISGTPGACGSGVVTPDPTTGHEWDTCFDSMLSAGAYTVAIMQYDNFANGPTLADGFSQAGGPNFTASFGCSNGQFCDVSSNSSNRTNEWAFDVLNAESAVLPPTRVPEPTTLLLLGLGLAGFGFAKTRVR